MRARAFVPTLALAFGAASCGLLRDYTTYRRLVAHERELALLEIVRYDLAVDLLPAERAVHVTAQVTFQNHGERPIETVRVLLHPEVELAAARCGGRERFVALLARFHAEFAFQSADLDDLVALAREMYGQELDDLFALWLDSRRGGDELFARGREMLERRGRYWREREPAPSTELRAQVDGVLAQAVELAERSDLAGQPPAERSALAARLFGALNAMPALQVTVVDRRGDLVYHVDGLTGNVLGHRDVRGSSVYGALIADERPAGSFANFDFTQADLHAARENYGAWKKQGELALVVEGHFWRAIE